MGAIYSLPPMPQQQYLPPYPNIYPSGPSGMLMWSDIYAFFCENAYQTLANNVNRHINRVIHWIGTICSFNHAYNIVGVKMNPSLSTDPNVPDVLVKMPLPTYQFYYYMGKYVDFTGQIVSVSNGVANVQYLYYQYGPSQLSGCPEAGNKEKLAQDLTPQPLSYCQFIKDASPLIVSTLFYSFVGKDIAFTCEITRFVSQQCIYAKMHQPICSSQTGYDLTANFDAQAKIPMTVKPTSVCTIFGKLDSMEQNGAFVVQATSITHHNNPNASIQKLPLQTGKVMWDSQMQRIYQIKQFGDANNACLARMRGQQIAAPVSRGMTPPRVMPGQKSVTPPKIGAVKLGEPVTPPKIGMPVTPPKIGGPITPPKLGGAPYQAPEPEPRVSEPKLTYEAPYNTQLTQEQQEPSPAVEEPDYQQEQPIAEYTGEYQGFEGDYPYIEYQQDAFYNPQLESIYDEATGKVKLDEPDSEFKGKDPSEVAVLLMRNAPKAAYTETAISANLLNDESDDALSRLRALKQSGIFNHFEEAADEHLNALGNFVKKAPVQYSDYYGAGDYYNEGGQNDYYNAGGQSNYYDAGAQDNYYYAPAAPQGSDAYSGYDYNSTQATYGSNYDYNSSSTQNYDYNSYNYGSYGGAYDYSNNGGNGGNGW